MLENYSEYLKDINSINDDLIDLSDYLWEDNYVIGMDMSENFEWEDNESIREEELY